MRGALPRVILITDFGHPQDHLERVLRAVLPLGSRVAVQHRHVGCPGRAYLEEARWLRALCEPHQNPLFVNERVDVALAVGANVHLPTHGAAPSDVRRLLPGAWLSVAVHSAEEAGRAAGADLALVSPVLPPTSKPLDTRPPLGWRGFATLARALPCPAYALGGITPERVAAAAGEELQGVAVMGAIWSAEDPRSAAQKLLGPWALQ